MNIAKLIKSRIARRNIKDLKRRDQSGFTLLELVVVIVVIGILAAMSFPTWGSLIAEADQQGDAYVAAAAATQTDCNALVADATAAGFDVTGMCDN